MERASGARGPQPTTARDLVLGYLAALHAIDEAMREAIPPLEQLADVTGLIRTHRLARSRRVGPYFYKVHGAGCRFITGDGTEVDVDFAADGRAIFDLWRLRRHAQSLPEPIRTTDQDLRSAVDSLQPPLVEVRPGWFGVAEAEAPA
ncbi:DUF6896 domain-containing protein [Streptomyces sp. Tue6028]|uniref:DUF6896 domain-containing protein n=1 Tax=Streptomyces sp. Tue6028 TaxID=2036037 RepID=UPI003D72EC07